MLRTAAARLIAPSPRLLSRSAATRNISASTARLVRIRSSAPPASNAAGNSAPPLDGAAPSSPTSGKKQPNGETSGSASTPSMTQVPPTVPSEGPSSVPPTTEGFEPSVNQSAPNPTVSPASDAQTSTPPTGDSLNTPLTPPSPDASASSSSASTDASGSHTFGSPHIPDETPFDRSKLILPSLDIDPEANIPQTSDKPAIEGPGGAGAAGGSGRERTGAGKKEYVSSIERQRRMLTRVGMGVLVLGGLGGAWYAANNGEVSWLAIAVLR
jgi:import inner membrane translocase subunit TIM50